MNEKTILTELMHIDAPLVMAECVTFGETVKNPPWAKEEFNFSPYCIFERKTGTILFLYDPKGMDWKIDQAGKCDEQLLSKNILSLYSQIKDQIKNEKALTKEEIKNFLEIVKEFWVWLDGLWWAIEYKDKNGLDASELMKVRKETEYFVPGFNATIRNSFKELLPEYKEYTDVLLIDEVLQNRLPIFEELNARKNTCVYAKGKLFSSIEEVKVIYNIEIEESEKFEGGELKGQTAYPGKVTSTVKIIRNREDMNKFQKGDIIVSPTTTPDFLSIMKECGAIISEHGGIICHASITSRELKIPCVVGVKGATKFLKDGDMVEVDANKGIVRIVN
jgi:phosphohistidine swiveling domain-containing protein